MSNHKPERAKGLLIYPSLLLVFVAFAALPMLAGVVVGAAIPGVAQFRPGISVWHLLHLLWMHLVLFLVGSTTDALAHFFTQGRDTVASTLITRFIEWVALALMYTIFFIDGWGRQSLPPSAWRSSTLS